jgi:hypothetical protein
MIPMRPLRCKKWNIENTIKKAITSCKQSGNDPDKHFVGADKMIGIGNATGLIAPNIIWPGR